MIKVLIADDHSIVREGLKQILADTRDMVVADEACSGQKVLEKISKKNYDVVILDISMPGRGGLEVLKQIKSEKPKLPVLILSMFPEEQYALRVLRAGASGYLTKESAPEQLIAAIRRVAQGMKYVSESLAGELARVLEVDMEKAPHERLSDREYQVMCKMASGRTLTQIADELALSVKTINTYRARILEKMEMKNNAEMTHYAIKNKLVF